MSNPNLASTIWRNFANSRAAWILPLLIAPLILLVGILHYGVNVPFQDDWNMVPLLQKTDAHSLTAHDLWKQRNEHRVLFPNIVMIVSAYVTKWNLKAFMVLGLLLSVISALLIYLFVLSRSKPSLLVGLTATIMSFWFFSPVQSENWLWGDQVIWFVCFTSVLGAIYLVDKLRSTNSKVVLYGAIAAAVVASFSLGGGLTVWLVGLAMLLAYRKNREILLTWAGSAVVSTALYYYHYQRPESTQSFLTFAHHPHTFFTYYLALFGRPVSSILDTAVLAGGMLLLALVPLLYLVWQNRAKLEQYVPWLAIILFSLMMATVTALARAGAGEGQSLSSRYCAFTVLYIVGLLGLSTSLINFNRMKQNSKVIIILILLIINVPLLISSYATGLYTFRLKHQQTQTLEQCSHAAQPSHDCLATVSVFDDKTTVDMLRYLHHKHWAGY